MPVRGAGGTDKAVAWLVKSPGCAPLCSGNAEHAESAGNAEDAESAESAEKAAAADWWSRTFPIGARRRRGLTSGEFRAFSW